jgi:hypothetical protein
MQVNNFAKALIPFIPYDKSDFSNKTKKIVEKYPHTN